MCLWEWGNWCNWLLERSGWSWPTSGESQVWRSTGRPATGWTLCPRHRGWIHYARGTGVGGCLCVPVSQGGYIKTKSEAAALATHMFRCQQLERLGSEGQLLSRQCLNPGTGGIDTACMYIFSTEPILLSQREGNRIRPSVLFAFVRVLSVSMLICVTNCLYIYVYVCHTCLLVHVPTGNTCPAPLVVAPGDTELQQPHLYQATRSVSPLITTKLPRFPYRKQQKEVQIHALQSKQ